MRRHFARLAASLPVAVSLAAAAAAAQVEFVNLSKFDEVARVARPTISQDGRFVAFLARINPLGTNSDLSNEIWLRDVATGGLQQLTSLPAFFSAASDIHLSADGQTVLFQSAYNFETGQLASFRLWSLDVATKTITRLPRIQTIGPWYPSADGRFVAVISREDFTGENPDFSNELFRLNVATGEVIQLSGPGEGVRFATPGIDADGDTISWSDLRDYSGAGSGGSASMWIWRESTGQVTAVDPTTIPGSVTPGASRISDSGRYVAFNRSQDIIHVDMVTGVRRLAGRQGFPPTATSVRQEFSLSPDGLTVCFERNDRFGLWLYSAATGERREVPGTSNPITLAQSLLFAPTDISATGAIVYRSLKDLDPDAISPGSGNVDLFVGLDARPVGSEFCAALPNSTGGSATLSARGAYLFGLGQLTFRGESMPPGTPAVLLFGDQAVSIPLGSGELCVGGSRSSTIPIIEQVTPAGLAEIVIPFGRIGSVWMQGTTWSVQQLFRDDVQGVRTVNLSNALEITF